MNIFYLDHNPVRAAQMQCNKHVVKMVLETAQLLCTAHRELGNDNAKLYNSTHINHPSAVWARESSANYQWLYVHFMGLAQEYRLRYGKEHKSWRKLGKLLRSMPPQIKRGRQTPVKLALPTEYKRACPVESYRAYYAGDKAAMLSYTKREWPEWLLPAMKKGETS